MRIGLENLLIKECTLCGSEKYKKVYTSEKSIFSDLSTTTNKTEKVECLQCGIIRNLEYKEDNSFYENQYSLGSTDYKVAGKTISTLKYEWIKEFLNKTTREYDNVLEIGSWDGKLLEKFNIPNKYAIEPNLSMARCYQDSVIELINDSYEAIDNINIYLDLIISFTVLEHIIDPNNFLSKVRKNISDNGEVIIVLPIQDNFSYDVLFYDHLYHFNSEHLISLFEKNRFDVIDYSTQHFFFKYFGLFHLKKSKVKKDYICSYSKINNIDLIQKKFTEINNILKGIKNKEEVAIFGNGEVSGILQRYTDVLEYSSFIIDDVNQIKRNEVPIYTLSGALEENLIKDIKIILLLVNKEHYKLIKEKILLLNSKIIFMEF